MIFPDATKLGQQIVKVDRAYAAAHVSRATSPEQICNFLEVCGLPRDPSISFCAAGGSYGVIHAVCDLTGVAYSPANVVHVFRSMIPFVEQHWIKVSASCEDVRKWAIARGKWLSVDAMPDDLVLKAGWVALMNFETTGPEAHHYATITQDSPPDDQDAVPTVEFNTSDVSQGRGGCVELKRRLIDNPRFRGIIRTY